MFLPGVSTAPFRGDVKQSVPGYWLVLVLAFSLLVPVILFATLLVVSLVEEQTNKHECVFLNVMQTPLSVSSQSSSAGGSCKELTEPPTIATELNAKHPLSVSSGTAQQESNSEDEIEVPRTRDPCGEFDDPVNTENYLAERVPLEFSMSDHQWPERGDHTLLECIADDELEGQLHNSVEKVVSQQNLSADRKKTDCTEQCLPRSAQERGIGAASGKNFTSCNNLEEHFSGLRMVGNSPEL